MPKFKPTTPDAFGINPAVFQKPGSLLLQEDIEFLDTPELAEALEVQQNIIHQMIDRKAITIYRVAGKILFRRTDVLAYLDHKEEGPQLPSIPDHASITSRPGKDTWRQRDNFDAFCDLIGYILESSPKDNSRVGWRLLQGRDGKVMLIQRAYRDGVGFIMNPSEESLERYRANPWMSWNDSRILRF